MKTNPIDFKKVLGSVVHCVIKRPLLTLLLAISLQGFGYAQITLKTSGSLESALFSIRKQSGYDLFYEAKDLKGIGNIRVDLQNVSVKESLDYIFKGLPLQYRITNKSITILRKPVDNNGKSVVSTQKHIEGKVVDENGRPIKGASIREKSNPRNAVLSNEEGSFILPITSLNEQLIVSYIGFDSQEIKATMDLNKMTVRLVPKSNEVSEVIITGMMERKKESFTGATSTFTGEELKMVGNQNIIAGLRALDPSFIQVENNSLGSNPNALPTLELRGQTSITTEGLRDEFSHDPNQPLFILDGFETSLRTIVDLDMNIVQSVTILKDAASTATYGSRASNGVVVVETIKPKSGKIKLSYTADLKSEFPDLNSYNMMNAAEKLEFERLSGRYYSSKADEQLKLDALYNSRLENVLRGVDTYWLNKPLQTGYSHRHSISARGGEGAVVFDVGVNYKNTQGIMIGSGRQDYGANMNLSYRKGKFNISNRTFIVGYSSEESSYGSFATWAEANPYHEFADPSVRFLSQAVGFNQGKSINISNPMYNAALNSFDESSNFNINNNIQLQYTIDNNWKITASGQISKANTVDKVFISPLNTSFEQIEYNLKGSLDQTQVSLFNYTANAMLTYAKLFGAKHSVTTNLRAEVANNKGVLDGFKVLGFPSASNGNPAFSYGYGSGARPLASTSLSRRQSFIVSGNYSYDQRYNMDVNYSVDGSTNFGSDNPYSSYYSLGLSWNAHKESFLQDITWLHNLRVRGNAGLTGNQNFNNSSETIFQYNSGINRFGQGIYFSTLGAPDLRQQRTIQTSVGLDASLFKNRFNMQLNAYNKKTDPLVVAITLPSSTGLRSYPYNVGTSTIKGLEMILNYSPIFKPADRAVLTFGVTGAVSDQKYSNFNNTLRSLNEKLLTSNSMVRFRDGYSPRDLWAVKSLGIDPGTGQEVFLTQNGEKTFNYSPDDIVVVGNSQPLAEGVLRGSLLYKGFSANVFVRFILNRDFMNTALYNKVENISNQGLELNQDRRALYSRWQNPGDHAQFKAISTTSTTPISSRFVQKETTFTGESINLGYEFTDKKWLDRMMLSNVRLSAYMNDIFYSSTVRRERGIDYPFARSVSMSLFATFK
ncbi:MULTISPECIES: SusC/RagA family TonB-linked outer membrane protein [Sphingobacterium]|uniref:SusC/RagA family TonB-linked outer membrane protein n=1 Tax=Sphingobacterium TaxID=28453 RepID=UPI0013D8F978|nr:MULTISPECIES: SusC/RagA family TonB-linked outer membrane protein [unclassified Sphingobacterium]